MYFLALVEMCQRFALWGIGNLLVLFLIHHYQLTDTKATHLYGIFSGIALIFPILGGYLADKKGYRLSVILGSLFTGLGCFLIVSGTLLFLYLGLLAIAFGSGLFTPSMYAILGHLYKDHHDQREGGFSIYYSIVTLGSFLGTFFLGALGHMHAWGLAFFMAGVLQLLSLLFFLSFMKKPVVIQKIAPPIKQSSFLKKSEKDRIAVIVVLSFISILFWAAYNQGWSSMSLFALQFTDRSLAQFELPASWLLSLESLYLVLLVFPLTFLYQWLAKKRLNPSPPLKTVFALIAMGFCFGILSLGANQIPPGAESGLVSPWYLIWAYFFMALGELLLAPIGLALVTHLSPHRYTAFLVGLWYVCVGVAFYLGGVLGGMMTKLQSIANFFEIFSLWMFLPAALLLFFVRKLNQMRHLGRP